MELLYAQHAIIEKKNLNASTFGKNMFEKYLIISKKNKDIKAVKFLEDIIKVYNKHKLS